MSNPLTVFLIDDHGVVREGLRSFLSIQTDIEVVGEAASGQDALAQLKRLAVTEALPDVIVLDVQMPRMDGATVLTELRRLWPNATVVVLSSYVGAERVKSLLSAGASGYLEKSSGAERLIEAIRSAAAGRLYLDPNAARAIAGGITSSPVMEALSQREVEIVILVAKGLSNREIADELFISERTARTHVSHILMKLRLDSRVQAALWAIREGIVSIEETRS